MTDLSAASSTLPAVILATGLPFVAFLFIMLFSRSRPRLSALVSIGSIAVSMGSALLLLGFNWHMEKPMEVTARWLAAGSISIPFGFLMDPLSLLMLAIVASVSFLVQVYSVGYMDGDPGFSRYFGFMSLFAWAMMNLTVSPTLLQLYVFWELVGVASYLLIGFWYERFSATQAGKKAFVMTRTGDVAFFFGMLIVLLHMGNVGIPAMNDPQTASLMSPTLLTLSALLIFGGIVGKSAQFPLLTWLPDAMEGPTPVSALLHSATMVAAGVYLFARLFPFFTLSPTAMTVFLAVGTMSMLLASTMAMVSPDIKKVWAYSTISQLGFMIMGLAAGDCFAGVFHLTTHAGFKALLFLCSGVLIHHYETNDIFELGRRGRNRLKVPLAAITLGAAALSGIPPLSGYFSKEALVNGLAGLSNPVWVAAALLGVWMTSYYSFRVIMVLLFPQGRREAAGGPSPSFDTLHAPAHLAHDDERHRVMVGFMTWPLIVLACVTVVLGFLEEPLRDFLTGATASPGGHTAGLRPWAPPTALALAVLGAAWAWFEFGRNGSRQVGFIETIPPLYSLFAERWYLDHFYRFLVTRVIDGGLSTLCALNDNRVIDGTIDSVSRNAVEGGRLLARLHTGMIQYRLLTTFAVVVFLSLYFFF